MITSEIGVTETEAVVVNNFFLTVAQTKIFVRRIIPKNVDTKATIVIVHGFGEHSGLFLDVAQHFIDNKFEVLMLDMKGFGYSGCGRTSTSIPQMQQGVLAVIQQANIHKPLVLFGHSMGGLVSTNLAIDYPHLNISAIVVQAPFLGMPIGRELPWHKKLIVKLLGNGLHTFVLNSMINITSVSKNSQHIRKLINDTLVLPYLNLPLVKSMIVSIQKSHKYAHLIKLPYLILHGIKDQITPIRDSVNIIANLGSKVKKLVKFQDGYHELHHDQEKQDFYKAIDQWLDEINLQPLGAIDKTKRTFKSNTKSKKWIGILVVIYFILVIKLSNSQQLSNANAIRKLLSPLIFIWQIIKGQ